MGIFRGIKARLPGGRERLAPWMLMAPQLLFGKGGAGILKGGVAVRTCTDRICAWVFQRILPVARRETAGNQLSLDSGEHNGPGVGFWR